MTPDTLSAIVEVMQGITDGALYAVMAYFGLQLIKMVLYASVVIFLIKQGASLLRGVIDNDKNKLRLVDIRDRMGIGRGDWVNSTEYDQMCGWVNKRK